MKKEDKRNIKLLIGSLVHFFVACTASFFVSIFGLGVFAMKFRMTGSIYYSVLVSCFVSALMMLLFILMTGWFRGGKDGTRRNRK